MLAQSRWADNAKLVACQPVPPPDTSQNAGQRIGQPGRDPLIGHGHETIPLIDQRQPRANPGRNSSLLAEILERLAVPVAADQPFAAATKANDQFMVINGFVGDDEPAGIPGQDEFAPARPGKTRGRIRRRAQRGHQEQLAVETPDIVISHAYPGAIVLSTEQKPLDLIEPGRVRQ